MKACDTQPSKGSSSQRGDRWREIDCEEHRIVQAVVEAEKKEDAVMEGSYKRINNQGFDISTKEQTKTLMTCTNNRKWILDDNASTCVRTLLIERHVGTGEIAFTLVVRTIHLID